MTKHHSDPTHNNGKVTHNDLEHLEHNDIKNIRPCWWGSTLWQTIFFIVATYPDNPTPEQIENIKCFFKSLKSLLPCEGCKASYAKFTTDPDTNISNNNNFKDKQSLITFVAKLRDKVNGKLAHEYGVSLGYFKKKLSCMTMSESNLFDGRVCDMIEAPIFSRDMDSMVLDYLKNNTRYNIPYTKKLLKILRRFMNDPNFEYNNSVFKFVYKRHKKCRKIMTEIYHNMSEGRYNIIDSFLKHDTNLHKKLLSMGCTILHKENLEIVLDIKSGSKNKKNNKTR